MHQKSTFLILALVVSMAACGYFKNIGLLTNGKMLREDFVQAVPFEFKKGLIVVKARLNADSTEREFIFDTGAFNSKVEKGLAKRLGLKTVTSKTNTDSNGNSRTIEVARIDSLLIGETWFSDIGAGKVEYGEDSATPCIASDGIIGANLIKLAHWKIDYLNKTLYFSDTAFERKDTLQNFELGVSTPLLSGTPSISVLLNGKEIDGVLFDVGYNGGLILPAEWAKAFPNVPSEIYCDKSTTGIYGTREDTITSKLLHLNIGGFEAEIPVEFSTIGKGLLGNEILEHFTVYVDYEEMLIHLQLQSAMEVPGSIAFLPGVLNDSLWVVARSQPGMPIQLGDTLRSINGQHPEDVFTDYCEYFMNIRSFLDQDSLEIITAKGEEIFLNR